MTEIERHLAARHDIDPLPLRDWNTVHQADLLCHSS